MLFMSMETDRILSLSGGRFQDFMASLSPEDREAVQSQMETRMCDPGQILIQQGDDSEFTLFIEEGAVEVIVGEQTPKVVSYLGRGDVVGELGMLNQQPRNASIQASSPVVYKLMYAEGFKRLMSKVPAFAIFFAGRMARKVKGSSLSRQHSSNCTDLAGKLPKFDLLAVLYTIATSGASGVLSVLDDEQTELGRLTVKEGIVTYADFRHLKSAEAAYQMLSEQCVGSFGFKPEESPETGSASVGAVTISIDQLLRKAAEIREELVGFPEKIMNLEGSLEILSPEDPGAPIDQRPRNELIIKFCYSGNNTLSGMWEPSGLSLYHFVKTIHYMTMIGMAKLK